jgi:hypothetical protein
MSWRIWGGLTLLLMLGGFFSTWRLPEAVGQRPAPAITSEIHSHVTPVNDRLQVLTLVDPVTRHVTVYHLDLVSGVMTLKSARHVGYDLQLKEYNTNNPLPSEIRTLLEQR